MSDQNTNRIRPALAAAVVAASLLAAVLAPMVAGAQGVDPAKHGCPQAPPAMNVIVSNASRITGTAGDDFICAGDSNNQIDARGGDDIVYGGGGNDLIWGRSGNDVLVGGAGADNLRGGPGVDQIDAGAGDDIVRGGEGNDIITTGDGRNRVDAGAGNDTVSGGDDRDVIRGRRGADRIDGAGGQDRLVGGVGADQISGGAGNDKLAGGFGNDRLFGDAGRDVAIGGAGADLCVSAERMVDCETVDQDPEPNPTRAIYVNNFSSADDVNRVDQFVSYRDPFVVSHETGASDHASTGGVNCSAPEQTRPQTRDRPQDHVYMCFPGGNPELGHLMAYAMDTTGYGFAGGLPDQVFEGVSEVSVSINTTSAGSRNFVEIKVLPADQTFVNALPCIPDLPCNDGWDYDDIGGVGAATNSQEGTGLVIATPERPDGHRFDRFASTTEADGIHYASCDRNPSYCFRVAIHEDNTGIRERFRHVFRDNGDGTVSFGVEDGDGRTTHWVSAPGSFPDGPVRVVVAFHNYTGTKSGNGPGYNENVSPSTGGFTWHWDDLVVNAQSATPSEEYFGGPSSDRIVTPDGCIAFSQGQRQTPHGRDIAPEFRCN